MDTKLVWVRVTETITLDVAMRVPADMEMLEDGGVEEHCMEALVVEFKLDQDALPKGMVILSDDCDGEGFELEANEVAPEDVKRIEDCCRISFETAKEG